MFSTIRRTFRTTFIGLLALGAFSILFDIISNS